MRLSIYEAPDITIMVQYYRYPMRLLARRAVSPGVLKSAVGSREQTCVFVLEASGEASRHIIYLSHCLQRATASERYLEEPEEYQLQKIKRKRLSSGLSDFEPNILT